ncbi:MAG: hypothetical protein FJZ00_11820, partial [Candidatus Sericytochromatia bacterium]|nr:hypothetical protein [Candidatus Tanganyikabacteria bacterium]
GEIVGRGYHPKVGEPHAEIFALQDAGRRAGGSTLYVTLEPCTHHGRTPHAPRRFSPRASRVWWQPPGIRIRGLRPARRRSEPLASPSSSASSRRLQTS